jgi:alkanesulfonate monooxygenase SsuD/methylene tetrahydromethanopterin reductase-like flavin-dependent oxidoreductase (luciferase family)
MLEQLAVAGESAGFEYLWVGDHLLGVRPDGGGGEPVLEAWTVLAALASVTRRCRVGVFVSNVSFRAPALLARMAATVDAVAGSGRLQLGVGAGWYEPEHEPLGFPFGSPADRVARLERHLRAVQEAWSAFIGMPGGGVPGGSPGAVPFPPLWVGGEGDVLLRRVVARHADWSCFGGSEQQWAGRRARLLASVDSAGRAGPVQVSWNSRLLIGADDAGMCRGWREHAAGEEYESWVEGNLVGTWPQVQAKIRWLAGAGCRAFIVKPADYPSLASVEALAANRPSL